MPIPERPLGRGGQDGGAPAADPQTRSELAEGRCARASLGFAACAYDAIGDHDAARRVDERAMKWGGLFRGAVRAHVREAKRAVLRKDYDTARKVAQAVIDAWGVADVPVPDVAEMKTLIASLPPPAQ